MVNVVRARLVIAILATILALTLGFLGRAVDEAMALSLAGLFWIVAIAAALALLPFWSRILPDVPPMPGLFQKPGRDERWCTRCGTPAKKDAACAVCGHAPASKQRSRPRSGSEVKGLPKRGDKPAAKNPRSKPPRS